MIAKRRYPVAARRARGLATILAAVSDRTLSIALGAVAALVFLLLTIGHPTVYDYFGRLAAALWRGEWWLDDAPAHLNELVQGVGGHRYALAPPMPALLLLPLVPLLGSAVAQTSLSAVLGGLSALPIFRAQRALGVPRALALWTTLLSTFGTTLLVTAVDGRSWFAGDAMAFFFAALALWSAAARAPAWLTGAALGAAILTRGPLALAIPGLLLLRLAGTARAGILPALIGFSAGLAPFAVAYLTYDLARWGTPLDVGYATFAQTDPFYTRGLFSLSYLPRQIYAMFFEAPAFVDEQLFFLRARSEGMSLLVATPAYLWLARAVLAGRAFVPSVPLWLCCLTLLPDLLFGTIGFEQYGYRRSLDAQAFLMPLVAVGAGWLARDWLPAGTALFRAAVILSVLITFYFFTTIRTFGFA